MSQIGRKKLIAGRRGHFSFLKSMLCELGQGRAFYDMLSLKPMETVQISPSNFSVSGLDIPESKNHAIDTYLPHFRPQR